MRPKTPSYTGHIIWRDLSKKITLTQDEIKKYVVKVLPSGGVEVGKTGNHSISLTELERLEITNALKQIKEDSVKNNTGIDVVIFELIEKLIV